MNKNLPKDHDNIRGARTVLCLEDVSKSYKQGNINLEVIKNASLEVYKGEMVSLIGESGCGKSTLLHIAGLLDKPDSGSIKINDINCTKLKDIKATNIRKNDIGFVYQEHHLLQEFTASENIMLPQIITGISKKQAEERANLLLDKVGLIKRKNHLPCELSGGEQQRIAIARSLANNPTILLADEPTGNLDPSTSKEVFEILIEYVVESGLSLFMVTHNHDLASKTDRVLTFKNGSIVPIKDI